MASRMSARAAPYEKGDVLGKGSFGCVFSARSVRTGEVVALKMAEASGDDTMSIGFEVLKHEASMLHSLRHVRGVPNLRWFGLIEGNGALAMDMLGAPLVRARDKDKSCVMGLFKQVLECLEACHQCGIVHRDIKPGNLMYGRGTESDLIFIIDFGLSCVAAKATGGERLQSMVGNALHSSASVMQRNRPGFGDDIVGLVYAFMDMFFCDLPWASDGLCTEETIALKKVDAKLWCTLRCPSSLLKILEYAESLPRESKPDYAYVSRLLRSS